MGIEASYSSVSPGDGYLLNSERIGNFEWWYFDCRDLAENLMLKIVVHLGTDPLRRRFFPTLALSVKTPETTHQIEHSYSLEEFRAGKQGCDVRLGKEVHIYSDPEISGRYYVQIDLHEFQASLTFDQTIPGMIPQANLMKLSSGYRSSDFFWNVALPGAKVKGSFTFHKTVHTLKDANGYHDHNYWQLNSKRGLYMDEVFRKWLWGKCVAGPYTVIFAEILMSRRRSHSLMVAREDKLIYSTNKYLKITVQKELFHSTLKSTYPSQISLSTEDRAFPLKLILKFEELVDSKNLLKGVNPRIAWLIKHLVARPAYYGINSSARLEMPNCKLDGAGNYELMLFRNRKSQNRDS